MLLARITLATALLAAACSDDVNPGVCLGDCTLPLEIRAVNLVDATVVPIAVTNTPTIKPPLQGGWVLYAGVEAHNVHEHGATLSAAIRAVTTAQVLSIEERGVSFVNGASGWATPMFPTQDLANLPVCGPVPGPGNFDESMWRLELTLRDSDGRTATTTATIAPQCEAGDQGTGCRCDCRPDTSTACTR